MKNKTRIRIEIRSWMIFFLLGLLVSGVTAFPLEAELRWLTIIWPNHNSIFFQWLQTMYHAIKTTNETFPQLSYGSDWLAFAHIVIAVVFIGPLIDPVRNIWVIKFGCIACILIFPLALITGPIRHIPFFWQVIDCSFGIIGLVPLLICYKKTLQLEKLIQKETQAVKTIHTDSAPGH